MGWGCIAAEAWCLHPDLSMKSQVQSCSRIAAVTGMRGLGAGTILSIVDSEMILILWSTSAFFKIATVTGKGGGLREAILVAVIVFRSRCRNDA